MIHPTLPHPWLFQLALACVRSALLVRWAPFAIAVARPWIVLLRARAFAFSARALRRPWLRP